VRKDDFTLLRKNAFPTINQEIGKRMVSLIEKTGSDGDSIGGIVECGILGLPIGLGDPMFEGMENLIASAVFAIPAVKGIEFGNGFAAAELKGSENNDAFRTDGERIYTETNNHGGILGGITSGMPLVFSRPLSRHPPYRGSKTA
jgi:chorismate synthase